MREREERGEGRRRGGKKEGREKRRERGTGGRERGENKGPNFLICGPLSSPKALHVEK